MDQARWIRIEALLEAALTFPTDQRAAFIKSQTADDPALAAEVCELIDRLVQDPDYLERPTARMVLPEWTTDLSPVPEQVGPYLISRRLGLGGMGEVFLAHDPGGEAVAVKLMRAGVDFAAPLDRFELERRILGSLDHPGIARLLDFGVHAGRPWLAMEFVEGESILGHADRQSLSISDRLALFCKVIDAVQHAHQHLVVHRDLKPANILVAADGAVKLLDFGISKVLDESALLGPAVETRDSDRLLTIEYAAPEQLRGEPISTGTDVHALGVLLYQLLTGLHPFRTAGDSHLAVEQAILERAPVRPSDVVVAARSGGVIDSELRRFSANARGVADTGALRRRLAGDLDTIVLKALRKEPDRRYRSAAALAEDIGRHLGGMPVTARPDTLGYRTRKFVRRNAGSVAIATLLACALAGTAVTALIQSGRASQAAAIAATERDQAVAIKGFMLEMLGSSDPGADLGRQETVRGMLDRHAARIVASPAPDPALQATLLGVMSEAYERLGVYARSAELARASLAAHREYLQSDHPDANAALATLGWALHRAGDSEQAESLIRVAVGHERIRNSDQRTSLARLLNDHGVILNALSRHDEASTVLSEALALRLAQNDSGQAVGVTASNLAAAHFLKGDLNEAIAEQQRAVAALEEALGADHQRSVVALGNLAAFQRSAGQLAEATTAYRELLARQTRIQGAQHPITARVMMSLAVALGDATDSAGAFTALVESDSLLRLTATIQHAILGSDHVQLGVTLDRLTGVLLNRGLLPAADSASAESLRILTGAYGDQHQSTATIQLRRAQLLARSGRADEAVSLGRRSIEAMTNLLGPEHPETARALGRFCEVLVEAANADEAAPVCTEAASRLAAAPAGYSLDRFRVARLQTRLSR